MISPQEIRTVTFDKTMRGYRPEDVDSFLQQVSQDMEQLAADSAEKEKKLYILAEKIEEYRRDEDNLKTALLNAQRMGENVIREAKQKAESILREANIRADTLTRVAKEQVEEQQEELERIKAEITRFKNEVLAMYKQHIELLSDLPGDENTEQETADAQDAADAAPAEPEQMVAAEQQSAEEEIAPQQEVVEEQVTAEAEVSRFPDLSQLYGTQESAASQPAESEGNDLLNTADYDTEVLESVPVAKAEEVEEPTKILEEGSNSFQGFKGIKFSD